MKDRDRKKEQPMNELTMMRQRVAELEKAELERKQAETALKVSETRYRRLFETAQDGILILDAGTGEITDVNPFLIDMLGYTHGELMGKKLWEIGAFNDIQISRAAFRKLQRKGYVRYEDIPLNTKDGREIAVEFVSNVYQVNHHNVIQCNIRDITDRKLIETELRKVREELEIRVRKRTDQLSKSNRLLNQEIAERRISEEKLRNSQERLRFLTAHLQKIREQERSLLSRELHDELGQVLTGIKMDLSWIAKRLPKDNTLIFERVDSLLTHVDNAILDVQRISTTLRPPALDDFGLTEAMNAAAKDFERRTTIVCEFSARPRNMKVSKEVSTEVFRIFQEALTNITRHALAQRVEVSLQKNRDRITLEVRDDGRGIKKKEIIDPKSIGLTGMRERAYAVEGSLTVIGIPGKGTSITFSVPLNKDTIKDRETARYGRNKQPEKGG